MVSIEHGLMFYYFGSIGQLNIQILVQYGFHITRYYVTELGHLVICNLVEVYRIASQICLLLTESQTSRGLLGQGTK